MSSAKRPHYLKGGKGITRILRDQQGKKNDDGGKKLGLKKCDCIKTDQTYGLKKSTYQYE